MLEWDICMGLIMHVAFGWCTCLSEYNWALALFDQLEILALGQVAGPQMTKTDVDSDEEQHDLDGVVEEQFQDGGAANPGLLFMVEADLD